ncbi:MAG: NAD(P)/FAD-dependent oxidoreductase [Acidobacteriota bacterium]
MPKVVIVGAGLAGSLLAIYLAKRGFQIDVFEARGDMRKEAVAAGRSINLALSNRGIAALREIGLDEYMLAEAVPMQGRIIHSISGETKMLPYSGRSGEYINSVSRSGLNSALIDEAAKYAGVQFIFNEKCIDLHVPSGELSFDSGRTMRADTVIAADGGGSAIRQSLEAQIPEFAVASVFLEHGYKELHIPPGNGGEFQLEKNALHIWPRNRFMMIALPNADGSFTCTLFLAQKAGGADDRAAFDRLVDDRSLLEFFESQFPDALKMMPTLIDDFFANPTGQLGTVKCWPWNVGGKALLIGDSAHAMVPFYGQGMNCAFEDVRVLDQLLEKHGIDWEMAYMEYGSLRKANTDAIQEMAVENFYEMRDAVADPVFQRKRELETKLEHAYPDYFSKYSMVTFREDLPYSMAQEKGNAQDSLLMEICGGTQEGDPIDLDAVMNEIRKLASK